MVRLLILLSMSTFCTYALEDGDTIKTIPATKVVKPILKKDTSFPSIDQSFLSPIIDDVILKESQQVSAETFCQSILKEIPLSQIRDSFHNMTPLPGLSLEITQEIFFYSLKQQPQILHPQALPTRKYHEDPLSIDTFSYYYHPLGRLLANGFRENHPSYAYLVDSCLYSLKAFKSFWHNRDSKPRKGNTSLKLKMNNLQKILTLDEIINELEMLSTPQKDHVRKIYIPSDYQDGSKSRPKSNQANTDLRNMVNRNSELKQLCRSKLKDIFDDIPSRQELLDEMQIVDCFIDYYFNLSKKFPLTIELSYSEILDIIEYNYPTIDFIRTLIRGYSDNKDSDNKDFDDKLNDAMGIIENLTPFATYYLECVSISPTSDTILSTLENLENLIHMVNHCLLGKGIDLNYNNQLQQLQTLQYLYYFAISSRNPDELTLPRILNDMNLYMKVFNQAMLTINTANTTISTEFSKEFFKLLDEEMMRLIDLSNSIPDSEAASDMSLEEETTEEDSQDISFSPNSKKRSASPLTDDLNFFEPQQKLPCRTIKD